MTKKIEYPTGPVDPDLPMELDDGTPVEKIIVEWGTIESQICVNIPVGRSPERSNNAPAGSYWYDKTTGIFGGGDARLYKVLRNVDLGPPVLDDWS